MGVKLGLSHLGKKADSGCLRKKYWADYMDLRGRRGREEASSSSSSSSSSFLGSTAQLRP
jgi:hypothetical protein